MAVDEREPSTQTSETTNDGSNPILGVFAITFGGLSLPFMGGTLVYTMEISNTANSNHLEPVLAVLGIGLSTALFLEGIRLLSTPPKND